MPGIRCNQAQNIIWLGFSLGLIFGFITAGIMYQGAFHIIEGIKAVRADPTSHIIVEYHDALVGLMRDEAFRSATVTNADQAQGEPTTNSVDA